MEFFSAKSTYKTHFLFNRRATNQDEDMLLFKTLQDFYWTLKIVHAQCIAMEEFHVEELEVRWVLVVEFHDPTLGIGKVFGQESTVVKWNYQILSLHLLTVCQKVPILDFQSEFSMSKTTQIFLKKNFSEIYQFRRKTTLLLKWRPIFDELSPDGDPKFGNFIWLQLILGQKPCFLGPIELVRWKVNIH